MSTRGPAVALCPELVTLVARSADPSPHRARRPILLVTSHLQTPPTSFPRLELSVLERMLTGACRALQSGHGVMAGHWDGLHVVHSILRPIRYGIDAGCLDSLGAAVFGRERLELRTQRAEHWRKLMVSGRYHGAVCVPARSTLFSMVKWTNGCCDCQESA